MGRTLAERGVLFAVAAALASLLHVSAKFSLDASILLAGLFTLIGLWVWPLWLLTGRPAYRIDVTLNNAALSRAFGLATSETDVHQVLSFVCIRPGVFVEELGGRFSSVLSFKRNVAIRRLASPFEDDDQELQIELLSGAVYTFVAKLSYPLLVNRNRVAIRDLPRHTRTGTFVLGTLPRAYFPEPDINSSSKLEFGPTFTSRERRKQLFKDLGWSITEEANHLWNEYIGVTYTRL